MHFASRLRSLPKLSLRVVAGIVAFILLVYYPVGMVLIHTVDDDPAFGQALLQQEKGSAAVATASALMRRELDRHWAPNDPFFYPGGALTRMPAFQRGMVSAVARFAIALADQIGRTRGSSKADEDLQKAVGLLNYPPNVWFYDTSVSWLPTVSSEKQYRAAVNSLLAYNERIGQGAAVFERRADNLLEALERFAADLGSSSAAVDDFVHSRSIFAVGDGAALYYETKGKLYAYYVLMRALEKDFANVIAEKQLQATWNQTLATLQQGMRLEVFVVVNAAPDSQVLPSHLAAQGFYLLRARTQMREISDILLK